MCVTSSGTLALNGMSFSSNAGYSTSDKALIEVNGGYLTVSGKNTFTSIKREFGNGGVFEFSSLTDSMSLSSIEFVNCKSTNGNGGALYAEASSHHELALTSMAFTSCSSGGYGGAIYVAATDSGSISNVIVKFLTFTTCSDQRSTDGMKGNGIFILGYDFDELSS